MFVIKFLANSLKEILQQLTLDPFFAEQAYQDLQQQLIKMRRIVANQIRKTREIESSNLDLSKEKSLELNEMLLKAMRLSLCVCELEVSRYQVIRYIFQLVFSLSEFSENTETRTRLFQLSLKVQDYTINTSSFMKSQIENGKNYSSEIDPKLVDEWHSECEKRIVSNPSIEFDRAVDDFIEHLKDQALYISSAEYNQISIRMKFLMKTLNDMSKSATDSCDSMESNRRMANQQGDLVAETFYSLKSKIFEKVAKISFTAIEKINMLRDYFEKSTIIGTTDGDNLFGSK